ncbi:MAG: hypothetical protein ABIH38_04860 [Patescibacteria group bacterium]
MTNQKGVINLAIPIVIAAALIGAVAFGYFYWLPKEKENNNTNTNISVSETDDWNSFSLSKFGFSFKYPKEWQVYEIVSAHGEGVFKEIQSGQDTGNDITIENGDPVQNDYANIRMPRIDISQENGEALIKDSKTVDDFWGKIGKEDTNGNVVNKLLEKRTVDGIEFILFETYNWSIDLQKYEWEKGALFMYQNNFYGVRTNYLVTGEEFNQFINKFSFLEGTILVNSNANTNANINTNASSNVNLNTNISIVNTDCSNGWLTYTNQKYGYTVKYPNTMTVTELTQDEFSLSEEEGQSGLTFAQKFANYGEELCVTFKINNTAYVTIAAPAAVQAQMTCGRTGVGAILNDVQRTDPLTIDGTNYTGAGHIYISEDPDTGAAGTTLEYKNETNHVSLGDKTSFEYGSTPAENVLYTAYEPLRETLICLMESYNKL